MEITITSMKNIITQSNVHTHPKQQQTCSIVKDLWFNASFCSPSVFDNCNEFVLTCCFVSTGSLLFKVTDCALQDPWNVCVCADTSFYYKEKYDLMKNLNWFQLWMIIPYSRTKFQHYTHHNRRIASGVSNLLDI